MYQNLNATVFWGNLILVCVFSNVLCLSLPLPLKDQHKVRTCEKTVLFKIEGLYTVCSTIPARYPALPGTEKHAVYFFLFFLS